MQKTKRFSILAALLVALLVLAACGDVAPAPAPEAPAAPVAEATAPPAEEAPAAEEVAMPTDRMGAWVDEVVAVEEPSPAAAVTRLGVGELDVYASTVSDPDIFNTVRGSADLGYSESFGSYSELTFNPAGPVFGGTGALNPFSVPRVREAMNMLIDRDYIVQEIYGGLAVPRYLPVTSAFPDYALLVDIVRELELSYAHNPALAAEIIGEEMEALGAELVDGIWNYDGAPAEIIVLIRTEDERLALGDYVSNLLEDIGFAVRRDYRTAAEASPVWIGSDPDTGGFHVYTGGWITTAISRDQADNFEFFYTERGLAFPLWQAYTPTEEFDQLSEDLANRNFTSLEERRDMFARAMQLSMEDSVRIWVVDRLSFSPFRANVEIAADLAGAISGSRLWALTARKDGVAGGTLNLGLPSVLPEPWNPLNGSNWIFDQMLIRGTADLALIPDPYTGLQWPQRLERAEVVVQADLPVGATLDWVDLSFAEEIVVPGDAWVDWDAETQTFITADEKFPEGLTALRKSVSYYPADLFDTVKWHDGSNLSVGDFVMGMILTFDRAKEESAAFDESLVSSLNSFLAAFRGFRITSTDPLVIEFYSQSWFLDAELNVTTLWPNYNQGPGAWHNLGLGLAAEAGGDLAYSSAKSSANEVEWTSFVAGPSLSILAGYLETLAADNEIPYAPTMSQFISEDEAASRWANLQAWYGDKGHFWLGTGPLFLQRAFPIEGTVQLLRFPDFPDPADKWDRFSEPMIAEVEVDGPSRVTIGEEAVFEIFVDFDNMPYPADEVRQVKYLVFGALGNLVMQGDAELVADGLYEVVLSAEDTAALEEGANRFEVAVVPLNVSIPSFDTFEFVTVP